MTKYQNAVMWLGLALIALRYLTSGQRSLFHGLFTTGGLSDITPIIGSGTVQPQGAAQNQGKAPTPTPNTSPTPHNNVTPALPGITQPIPPGVAAPTQPSGVQLL